VWNSPASTVTGQTIGILVHGQLEARDDPECREPDFLEHCLVVVSIPRVQLPHKHLDLEHEAYSHHAEHRGGTRRWGDLPRTTWTVRASGWSRALMHALVMAPQLLRRLA
jgi:hypothetical protein